LTSTLPDDSSVKATISVAGVRTAGRSQSLTEGG
jgi:hypothetical protein